MRELIEGEDISECALIVDIEGAEQELLRDELDTLTRYCSIIIIEFHRSVLGEDLSGWIEILKNEYELVEHNAPVFAFIRDDSQDRGLSTGAIGPMQEKIGRIEF